MCGMQVLKYIKLVNEVKSNMESETKREIAERTLNERGGQQMAIYTYGLVESGWLNGGAACVTRWNGRDIVRRIAGGKMCSSFGAEALAMREAMRVNEFDREFSEGEMRLAMKGVNENRKEGLGLKVFLKVSE